MSADRRMTAEEAEDYTQALGSVLTGGYRLVFQGWRLGVPAALNLTVPEWVEKRLGGYIRMAEKDRRKAIAAMQAERQEHGERKMSTRELGAVLGVSHNTAAVDQAAAVKNLTAARRDRNADAAARRIDRDRRELAVKNLTKPDIRHGTLREALADVADVDLVFTDPPYPGEFLPAWSELARWASSALKPGAWLAAYSGQYHLPEVIARLSAHLEYQWLGWIATPGPNVAVRQRPIQSGGKPLLLFSNGKLRRPFSTRAFADVARADGRTRIAHTWQQDEAPAAYYIDALSERGELVVDPFLGSGTFALVAHRLERRFIGCDVDGAAIATARERLAA